MISIEGNRFSAVRKQHLLLHNLGVEGKRVFENLPEPEEAEGEGSCDADVYGITLKKLTVQW